jgi:hypothetical protein
MIMITEVSACMEIVARELMDWKPQHFYQLVGPGSLWNSDSRGFRSFLRITDLPVASFETARDVHSTRLKFVQEQTTHTILYSSCAGFVRATFGGLPARIRVKTLFG